MTGDFGVVVLAAGGSSRLGRPKQLLPYLGRTLVEHAVRTALASGASEVVVVVGANAKEVRETLRGLKIRIVVNEDWAEGMGGSISLGVKALGEGIETAVVALGDQPRITPEHLRKLAERATPIAASSYAGVLGAPAAFDRSEFARLVSLKGEVGARHLVRSGGEEIETVEFASANVDVDTPEDYRRLVPAVDDEIFPSEGFEPDQARAPPSGADSPT